MKHKAALKDSLGTLGFNDNQINYAVDHIKFDDNKDLVHHVEEAIKTISSSSDAFTYVKK